MIEKCIDFFNSPEVISLSTFFGIVGFGLTIFVTARTRSIDKAIKEHTTKRTYNAKVKKFIATFEGHRKSINEDGNRTKGILDDILKDAVQYKDLSWSILSLKEKWVLHFFTLYLKKKKSRIDFEYVASCLAELSGHIHKR